MPNSILKSREDSLGNFVWLKRDCAGERITMAKELVVAGVVKSG